jgi:hypothetical protein
MKLARLLFSLILLNSITITSMAEEDFLPNVNKILCDSQEISNLKFNFCLYDPQKSNKSSDIVYFFHGLEGSEKTWFTQVLGTRLIHNLWSHWGYNPRIITVSFGPQWILADNEKYGYLRFMRTIAIPYLEKKIGGLNQGHRHLIGQSMGGFNAAEFSLKFPGFFSKVALLCPAITSVGPYSSYKDLERYIKRTGADRNLVYDLIKIGREYFMDQEDWENNNPLSLIRNYQSPKKSKYLISVGVNDDYGFYEGSRKFKLIAKLKQFSAEMASVPGSHCSFSRWNVAKFIVNK